MPKLSRAAYAGMGAALMALAGSARAQVAPEAGQTEQVGIGVRAIAQTVCRVEVDHPVAASSSGPVDLGRMSELCNNVDGYRVVLTHAPNLTGASAIVDGRSIPLDRSGRTLLVDADGPATRQRAVQVDFGGASGQSMRLSLVAEPKGIVW